MIASDDFLLLMHLRVTILALQVQRIRLITFKFWEWPYECFDCSFLRWDACQKTLPAFGSLPLVPKVLAVFSALLPQAFLPSGMSAPTSFSNFAALAYCFKALAWACTVASFQLQTYLLHRFSLCFFFRMSATALTLGRKKDWSASSNSVCAAERCLSQMSRFTHYITCRGGRDSAQGCQISLYMPRYHEKFFQAFFKIVFVLLLKACNDGIEKSLANFVIKKLCPYYCGSIEVFTLSLVFKADKIHHAERAVVFNK